MSEGSLWQQPVVLFNLIVPKFLLLSERLTPRRTHFNNKWNFYRDLLLQEVLHVHKAFTVLLLTHKPDMMVVCQFSHWNFCLLFILVLIF